MAVFKCKMCGGTLNVEENSTVAECEFCGTKQTLPKLSDEKRRNLYDRANHFRRNNDYDKAMSIYEQILNEDKTDAEAYWSIVLCRYGIEYVEDPATHKHVPTVNRTQFTSIFADEDYRSAIANADGYQKDIYEAEAKEIDKIQKGILAISGKEAPFDVFICYKETGSNGQRTPDSVLAQDLYFGLKNEGFNVFFSRITLEDKLGTAYEPYIFAALNSAKVMVVLGTKAEHFNAVWVKNEWSRFLALIKNGEKKTIIPAYKDMDPYDLPDEFSHLQAQDMSRLGFMQDLIRGIKKIMGSERSTQVKETVIVSEGHDIAPLLKRAFLFLEDGDFDSADEYCEKVLDINPECAEAYMAKLLVDLRVKTPEQLSECSTLISENSNYVKAVRFANQEYKTLLQKYSQTNAEYVADLNERNRKEAIYSNAIKRISTGNPDGTAYRTSISELQSIIDYKDSKEQVERITQMLERWTKYKTEQAEKERIYAEQERLADERRREQKRLEENRQKRKKKIGIISLIAFIVVALSILIPVLIINSAKSAAEKEADLQARNGLILEEKSDYYIVTGIEEFNENIIIPSTYKGKPVKEFTANVFSDNDSLKSIVIPNSITKIEARAFEGCNSLTSVTIGNGVTHIGGYAFMNCNSLENIAIGNGISSIEESVFWGCGALNYNEYDNVYYLGNNDNPYVCLMRAKDNNITSCVVNENTKIIYEQAFIDCYSLQNITFGKSVVSIAWSAFQTYGAALENIYYLGEITDWFEIEGLGGLMSKGKSSKNLYVNGQMLTDVVIPDTITSIPSYAFYGTTIESVIIGDSVTSIREYAFYNCQELTNITFSSTSEWFVYKFGSQGATGISPGILENFDIIKDFLISTYSSYWWSRR